MLPDALRTSLPYLGHNNTKNRLLPRCTLLPTHKAIALSHYYTIPRSCSALLSDSVMELKDKNHSAPPAEASRYADGLATSTGASRGSISNALTIERSSTSF